MLLVVEPDQVRAQERAARQVEAARCLFRQAPRGGGFAIGRGELAQIVDAERERDLVVRRRDLHRLAAAVLEAGP